MQVNRINNQTNYKSFGMRPLVLKPGKTAPTKSKAPVEQTIDAILNPFTAEYGTEGLKALIKECQKALPKVHQKEHKPVRLS